ncbi:MULTISPECIES: hypothetical protein [unclassified Carboxylicivirga]|uniref:hypothetical protein n=1 Tax=Carboxylicivirga TaxID=1628153 RepID=UPI003D3376C1
MIAKYIRLIFAVVFFVAATLLFVAGYTGTGIISVLLGAFAILFHFKNEMNLLIFYFVRKNKFATAETLINKVKHPERMTQHQEAYFYFLRGLMHSQKQKLSPAEKSLKKALSTGLRTSNDRAMANLNLAGISLSQRNKKLATYYLRETKKLDKQKMLTAQIREVEQMMRRI